jgi:hypothetical protein
MFDDLAIVHMGREALYFAVAWLRTLQQKGPAMSDSASSCFECKRPLTEIDNYGQRLKGCLTCNIWWSVAGDKVRLPEEDPRALHQLRRNE